MKIIHTADWHLGKNIEGHSRLDEQAAFLNDFITICEREQPDFVFIAGDIYDHYNPPAAAEMLFYETLKKLSRGGECLTVIISGNHDNPDRLTASGPLAKEHGIIMAGTPSTIVPVGTYGKHRITESGAGYLKGVIHGEAFNLILMPFPSEKRLGEVIVDESDGDIDRALSYEQRLLSLFEDLAKHFDENAIHLVISHLFMMNSVEEGSERSISLGGSYLLGSHILPKADYVALGHIHKPQKVPGDKNAWYSGSPIHYHLNELSSPKQVLSIEVEAGKPCQVTPILLPVYKPMEVWHCASVEEAIHTCRQKKEENSWVYMEVKTDHYIQEEDIKKMRSLKKDILSITPIFPSSQSDGESRFPAASLPFETLIQNFYTKKFGTSMNEETMSVLMEIIRGSEEEML